MNRAVFVWSDRVKKIGHFKYKCIGKNKWIVINCKTDSHSHLRSEKGCFLIIKMLRDKIYPKNSYLQVSYERLEDPKAKRNRMKNEKKIKMQSLKT